VPERIIDVAGHSCNELDNVAGTSSEDYDPPGHEDRGVDGGAKGDKVEDRPLLLRERVASGHLHLERRADAGIVSGTTVYNGVLVLVGVGDLTRRGRDRSGRGGGEGVVDGGSEDCKGNRVIIQSKHIWRLWEYLLPIVWVTVTVGQMLGASTTILVTWTTDTSEPEP